jgi:hypothetical protein
MELSAKISNLRRELFNEYHFDERFQQQFIELYDMAVEMENESSHENVVNISDFQRDLRREFNLDSRVSGNMKVSILSLNIKGFEIEIPITYKMTYRSLKEDIIKKLCQNTDIAKEVEILIHNLKKS